MLVAPTVIASGLAFQGLVQHAAMQFAVLPAACEPGRGDGSPSPARVVRDAVVAVRDRGHRWVCTVGFDVGGAASLVAQAATAGRGTPGAADALAAVGLPSWPPRRVVHAGSRFGRVTGQVPRPAAPILLACALGAAQDMPAHLRRLSRGRRARLAVWIEPEGFRGNELFNVGFVTRLLGGVGSVWRTGRWPGPARPSVPPGVSVLPQPEVLPPQRPHPHSPEVWGP